MAKPPYVEDAIIKKIEEADENTIFFLSDFSQFGAIETVRKVLGKACQNGILLHIAHGIYAKSKKSRFGIVPPTAESIAQAIAERDNSLIMPAGAAAANIVGLSTQVPMSLVYLTTGTARVINLGKRKIRFKRVAPSNFSYSSKSIPLVVQAMKDMEKQNIGDNEISAIYSFLRRSTEKHLYSQGILLAPQWIQAIVKPIINKILSDEALATV